MKKQYIKPKKRSQFVELRKYLTPKEMRQFIRNVKKSILPNVWTHDYTPIKPPELIIGCAFRWSKTPQDVLYWAKIRDRVLSHRTSELAEPLELPTKC